MQLAHSPVGGKRWIRLYLEILHDPKVQLLSPHLFKAWVNLLVMAGLNNGKLPSTAHMAYHLQVSSKDVSDYVDQLIMAELIDVAPDHSLVPHNWSTRQYLSDGSDRTVAARMRRYRQGKKKPLRNALRNGAVTVTEICSESVSESESDYSPSQEKDSEVNTRAGVHVGTRNAYARAKAGEGSV